MKLQAHSPKRKIRSNDQAVIVRASTWNLVLGHWSFFWILIFGLGAWAASRPPWTSNRVLGSPNPPAPYTVERLFPKLRFNNPVDLAALPGSDRLLVLEQAGKLFSFPARAEVEQVDLVFDFRSHHKPFDSAYTIAFHPRFAGNRFVFVCYAEPGGRTNGSYISRFTFSSLTPPLIDPASEKVILRWLSGGHNGCTLAFGNDGFLYISTGDAASPDPPDIPYKTGQDINDLLASILRIDVDRVQGSNAYAIPPSNPFVSTPGARPEVYAFGLRNPWRMSFDRMTGDLWVGDVGWEQWEMIYRVKAGGNYGWSLTEGPNTHVRTDLASGPGPILPPVVALPHSDAASITGGRVYHGSKLPRLRGAYLYGDWETGKFWALRNQGDTLMANDELCDTTLKPVSFADDHDNELLILDYGGGLYRFVPNNAPPANLAFPRKLSETGLFADVSKLEPAPGVVPYRINAEMWSDHATAERWLGIPGDDAIVTAGGRETIAGRMWHFPSNSVFNRTLTLEMRHGQPSSRRRIETQLLHFDGQTWNAYTYRWNPAQSDAELVAAQGTNDTFTVIDPAAPGGRHEIPWRFASRTECLRCHNAWAGETLSFNWLQLRGGRRREEADPTGSETNRLLTSAATELHRLEALGVLRIKNPPNPALALSNPYDHSLPLAERARSWLHVNCSTCHRNGAGGDVPSWFNYDQRIESSRAYDALPVRGGFDLLGARVIAPGEPDRSTLVYRINTEGSGHMPHVGSRLADDAGARLIRDWIRSLPPKASTDPDVVTARKLAEANTLWLERCRGETNEAVARLLGSMSGALALLDTVTSIPANVRRPTDSASFKKEDQSLLTSDATEEGFRFRSEVAAAAAIHTNALIRDLFQRLLPPDRRRPTLGSDFDPKNVLALKGLAARGKELFLGVSQCARCHVCEGAGRAFGPDMTGVGRKFTREQLLEQILRPSKVIAPEFKTTLLTLRDGTELSGFVLRRMEAELVLRDETLVDRRVKLGDIQESRESVLSAMPEGLLAPLTAQEVADLLEYLFHSEPTSPARK